VWKLIPRRNEKLVTIGAPVETVALNVAAASKDKTYGLMEVVTGKPIFETVTPEEEEDTVFSYPYAFVREAVVLMATVTTIMMMSLFLNAPLEELANRVLATSVVPYPPGIPMLMSGENFGGADSPQIGYLKGMQSRERQFPGFAGVIEGAEMIDGTYHVLCVKK